MGYMTQYRVRVIEGDQDCEMPCRHCKGTGKVRMTVLEAIEEVYKETESELAFIHAMAEGEPTKWYDHEKDMLSVSREWPDRVFRLDGEGKESGDIWVKFFKDGQVQMVKAEIKLGDFDSSKLEKKE